MYRRVNKYIKNFHIFNYFIERDINLIIMSSNTVLEYLKEYSNIKWNVISMNEHFDQVKCVHLLNINNIKKVAVLLILILAIKTINSCTSIFS